MTGTGCLGSIVGGLNEARKNLNIYVTFCNNFHLSVLSFASVANFRNCTETLWTLDFPRGAKITRNDSLQSEETIERECLKLRL